MIEKVRHTELALSSTIFTQVEIVNKRCKFHSYTAHNNDNARSVDPAFSILEEIWLACRKCRQRAENKLYVVT